MDPGYQTQIQAGGITALVMPHAGNINGFHSCCGIGHHNHQNILL